MLGRVLIKIWFPVLQILHTKSGTVFTVLMRIRSSLVPSASCCIHKSSFCGCFCVAVSVFILLAHDATLLLFAFNRSVCVRWGEKMVPSDSYSCSQPCTLTFHSLFPSPYLSHISNERWHAGSQQGVTDDTWGGWGGAFHIRLACPWKLMFRGSFALDMYLWGLGKWLVALPCTKKAERPASLLTLLPVFIKHEENLSMELFSVWFSDCLRSAGFNLQ